MNILSLIGNTPLIRLTSLEKTCHLSAHLYVKPEYQNPFGSIKDRTAYYLLKDLSLPAGSCIAEATSGNLGISMAAIGTLLGYRIHLFTPEDMPPERTTLMQLYGATVHLTPAPKGMQGALDALQQFKASNQNIHHPDQFMNPLNTRAHFDTTGPEIYQVLQDCIHHFIAGVGTGGTLTGTARFLKAHVPALQVTAVEPSASPALSKHRSGLHRIFGIGAGFIPPLLDLSLVDLIATVSDEDAIQACRLLLETEGLLCGPSSGAALHAALEIGKLPTAEGQNIVVILPDSGERYLSILS